MFGVIKDHFHFLIYCGLAVLYLLWKADKNLHVKKSSIFYFFLGGFILAFGSEFVQFFIPGRTYNPIDFYSNIAGILIGIMLPRIAFKYLHL